MASRSPVCRRREDRKVSRSHQHRSSKEDRPSRKVLGFLGKIVTVAAGVLHPGHVDIATTGCLLLLPWQRDSDVPVVKRSRLPATPPLSELQRMKSPPLGWTPSPFRSSERCRNHREGEDMQDQDGDQAFTGIDRLHLCSRVCVI